METAPLELAPGGTTLAIGHLDGNDLTRAIPADADRNQDRLPRHDAIILLDTSCSATSSSVATGLPIRDGRNEIMSLIFC
jgi:hypothetical protein